VDQYIYAVGGFDDSSQLSSVERYDVGSDQWTMVAPMNCPRSALTVSIINNSIYAIGKFCFVMHCTVFLHCLQQNGSGVCKMYTLHMFII